VYVDKNLLTDWDKLLLVAMQDQFKTTDFESEFQVRILSQDFKAGLFWAYERSKYPGW